MFVLPSMRRRAWKKPSWLSKGGLSYLCVILNAAIQAVPWPWQMSLNSASDGPRGRGLSVCWLMLPALWIPFFGQVPSQHLPTPEFHGCLLSPFAVLIPFTLRFKVLLGAFGNF